MTKANILVVEDEKSINDLIAMTLKKEGHSVEQAFDGDEAFQMVEAKPFDLVVLDWMLPHASGLDFLARTKNNENKRFGVLMVTAKVQNEDIVLGLDSGADDYITKPFDLNVLKARVKAILRRYAKNENETGSVMSLGHIQLNSETHDVLCEGVKIDLTISEFKLLKAVMANAGRVMTRKQLVLEIQGEGVVVVDRSIDTHMVSLRKKLGNCAGMIETVRGVGYRALAG